MKNIILCTLIVVCAASGILGVTQGNKIRQQRLQITKGLRQIVALQEELEQQSEAIENAKKSETKAKILQQTLTESTSVVVEQSKKAEQLQQSLAEAKTNNPLHGMAAMFKDPKMREMIKSQQKAALGPMIDKQYSGLFKQLNLTPDQAAAFKDLIEKKMLAGADEGFSMMDNSLDASQRADIAKQVKSQTDDVDNQIKQYLGDDNYQAFQSYEKSVPDRVSVGQFNDQFAGTANALTASQQDQLTQAMSDARNNFTWTSGLNQKDAGMGGDMSTLLTEDNINKFVQEREQFDQQFLTRAQQILSPEQLTAFQDFQKTQRDLQLAGLKMMAQMFNSSGK
ncbi:MAG TPA: hypothetical protein VG938_01985 [Verrucomicrobiae bacterium]|jgi:hypothetical protein|nr:hypothetical protein [Verrucomicrobiae bacterium]